MPSDVPTEAPASAGSSQMRGRAAWWEVLAVFVLSVGLAIALFHRAWAQPLHKMCIRDRLWA